MTMLKKAPRYLLLVLAFLAINLPSTVFASSATTPFTPRSTLTNINTGARKQKGLQQPNLMVNEVVQPTSRGGALSLSEDKEAIGGAIAFLALNIITNKLFKIGGVKFPAFLGGCMILFAVMVVAEMISQGLGDAIFDLLNPGATLLAKWMPCFFVPGLAMLPLAPSVGSGAEVVKVLGVTILGFVYSLTTVSFAVLGLRSAMGAIEASPVSNNNGKGRKATGPPAATSAAAPANKPFKDETLDFLIKGSVLSLAISIGATRAGFQYATPIQTVALIFVTIASFVWGALLPSGFVKVVHPLVTGTALTLAIVGLLGIATGKEFLDVLRTYKVGSLNLFETGAGDVLLYLLGPAVFSFSTSMYSRKKLLKDNLLVVLTSTIISSVGGLFGTAAFVRAISLGGKGDTFLRLSTLPRNVTTALAMVISSILGGDVSITASIVVLTGIIGATYGRTLLDVFDVKDPITRGLGIGASGQGLGVASISSEKDAFPFAAMSMVLTGVAATCLVSVPSIKELLINIANGGASTVE